MLDSTTWVAVVGVLGTLAGSALTGFITLRTERRKVEAADRQQAATAKAQQRELRVEHLRWRRDRRQAAYLAFVLAVERVRELCDDGVPLLRGAFDQAAAEQLADDIGLAIKAARSALATVRLEGPRAVDSAGVEFCGAALMCGRLIRSYLEGPLADAPRALTVYTDLNRECLSAEDRFLAEAEQALAELVEPG